MPVAQANAGGEGESVTLAVASTSPVSSPTQAAPAMIQPVLGPPESVTATSLDGTTLASGLVLTGLEFGEGESSNPANRVANSDAPHEETVDVVFAGVASADEAASADDGAHASDSSNPIEGGSEGLLGALDSVFAEDDFVAELGAPV